MKNLYSGTHCGGFQFLLILDLWVISFHTAIVFALGKNLLFKSVLGHCAWFRFPILQPGFGWKIEKALWNLATFTALDQDRTLLSKKVLIILSFICGLTPSQIRELKLKDLYKDHNSGNLCLRLKQSSKTEKTCQIPSEKYSKVVAQYFDRIYEDTGSAEG